MASTHSWLALAEYSMKHQVSISTLRRRIKAEDIEFRLEDGKYFILDDEATTQVNADRHRPSQSRDESTRSASYLAPSHTAAAHSPHLASNQPGYDASESVITAANRLLADLKKAYTQVLQEKENQIQSLRQELADIKTLVKILEFENEKLNEYKL